MERLETKDAYEMSHYGSTYLFLRNRCRTLESSEFFPSHPFGTFVDGVRNEDAQQLSFKDKSFDLVTSNQVFEHIPDILKCFQECHRVLRHGGSMLFAVPIYESPETEQVATIENGSIRWLTTPEFHTSRRTGPNSVPVFWRFSVKDIRDRVLQANFSEVRILEIDLCSSQVKPSIVIRADKA